MLSHACWLGSAMLVFFIGMHLLLLRANAAAPPRLPEQPVLRDDRRAGDRRDRLGVRAARPLPPAGLAPPATSASRMSAKKSFLLRIDPAVFTEVERLAQGELRSVNAQVEFLLRDALARRGIRPRAAVRRRTTRRPMTSEPARRTAARGLLAWLLGGWIALGAAIAVAARAWMLAASARSARGAGKRRPRRSPPSPPHAPSGRRAIRRSSRPPPAPCATARPTRTARRDRACRAP